MRDELKCIQPKVVYWPSRFLFPLQDLSGFIILFRYAIDWFVLKFIYYELLALVYMKIQFKNMNITI